MQASQVIPFQFEAREVRTCVINDQPWFAAQDILNSFDYAKTFKSSKAMSHVPEQWRGVYPIHTLGDAQKFLMLSEQRLYFFLGRSDKPKALPFQMCWRSTPRHPKAWSLRSHHQQNLFFCQPRKP